MKYLLTTFAALSLGSMSFRLAQSMKWYGWGERAGVWLAALILAALLCAPLWS
jgi:hypothetical protein